MAKNTTAFRLLIVDDDKNFSRRLHEFLDARGFLCRVATNAEDALKQLEKWRPQFVLYDMTMPDLNAISVLKKVQKGELSISEETHFVITSNHNSARNVRACIQAGASDFLVKPCRFEEILSRLVFHSQKRQNQIGQQVLGVSENYLALCEILLRKSLFHSGPCHDLVFDLLNMQAMAVEASRCSLIETDPESFRGWVRASSDDKSFSDFEIDLRKYPEVTTVLNTEKLVAIDNMKSHSTMAKIQNEFKDVSFHSMLVCPVWRNGDFFGVVSSRRGPKAPALNDSDLRFAQIIAHAVGLALQHQLPTAAADSAA